MIIRKNIVLNGVENSSQRALLTLECDGKFTTGKVRLYNFGREPYGIISLGIYQDGRVIKAGLTKSSTMLYTFTCEVDKLNNNFSCAVINFVEGEPFPILYGNSEGCGDKDELFGQVIDALSQSKNITEVEEVLDDYGFDYEENLKAEINQIIEENVNECDKNCVDCENCEYKNYYLSKINTQSLLSEESQEETAFYNEIKPQIDDLFAKNPSEEFLQNFIPNSKWVKVKIDEKDNYYVLGLIYEDNKLKYISYGVPGVYQKNAPRELSGYPVWFPLSEENPQGFGYWLSYQDAESGESVKATVV